MTDAGFLRLRQVLDVVPVCRTRWYEGVRKGDFPSPVKMGRVSFWRKTDIAALIEKIENGEANAATAAKSEAPSAATLEASKPSRISA